MQRDQQSAPVLGFWERANERKYVRKEGEVRESGLPSLRLTKQAERSSEDQYHQCGREQNWKSLFIQAIAKTNASKLCASTPTSPLHLTKTVSLCAVFDEEDDER